MFSPLPFCQFFILYFCVPFWEQNAAVLNPAKLKSEILVESFSSLSAYTEDIALAVFGWSSSIHVYIEFLII